jgi:hypothetical protein
MPRMLTNLKFWALAITLIWIMVIVTIILTNPSFAHGKA